MSYQTPRLELIKDNLVRIYHPDRLASPLTNTTAAAIASATTLTVRNNEGFAVDDLVLIEDYDASVAEIKKITNAITAGTSLIVSALTFAHGVSVQVRKILFDQAEISSSATPTGAKVVISTIALQVANRATEFVVTTSSNAYYFVRYKNSNTANFSDYSDAIASTDFTPDQVGFLRRLALESIGDQFDKGYSANWFYDQVYLCERDILKKKQQWSVLTVKEYDAGNVVTGMEKIALPSNFNNTKSEDALMSIRIGVRTALRFLDWSAFQERMSGVALSTCSLVSISDTSVTLVDSRDFADSGSITIAGTAYSYTTNTRSTGVLSGFTAFTASITASSNVWQGTTFGEPSYYSVNNGFVYFDRPISSDLSDRNIWMDYRRDASRPDSDGDLVMFDDPLLYINYLALQIKKRRTGDEGVPSSDPTRIEYEMRKKETAMRDKNPLGLRMVPAINEDPYY